MKEGEKLVIVGCSGAGGPAAMMSKKTPMIGGQIVSHAIAPAREIDAVTAFILNGRTIRDLTTFTSACNPDISSEPSAEPITIAAEQALQKIK